MQVRARCVEECPNLPLKAFKDAIIENFDTTNKFKYELTEAQVGSTSFHQHLHSD